MNFKNRKRDQFKGHQGKILRKKLYGSKKKNKELIDDEIQALEEETKQFDSSKCSLFKEFPISKKTLKGLDSSKYVKPTDIQRESISLALNGNDILGAAKTGSGKTLAFIIPVIECLYRYKWSQFDGLGALVISPTRELAFQTFEVLKKVGKFHDFSAGLVIGGKPLKEEAGRINRTNIVICTPGRLLQHMDETTYFSADSLKILVLDEADRILDLGFAQTMNAIIENLPSERQTLLFSATQTRSVKDLARLSLQDPMFVSVHENATQSTPEQLEQSYVVCELHDKMNMLWSFLKNHLRSKILVFLTSCKQVKYIHEAMRKLQPGIPVLALHGGMPQLRRTEAYNQFVVKQRACLFATDIAARGLDFPAVNWVVQLDCPEDANTYIHRAGRTARYQTDGQSLLVLLPSEEEAMASQLTDKKIPIEKIRINQKKFYSIQAKLESFCAEEPALKESAQRVFMTYLKAVFLMKNKKVFDVHSLDIDKYASSLGLAIAPKVRFLKKDQKRKEERHANQAKLQDKLTSAAAEQKVTKPGSSSESSSGGENGSEDESDSSSEEVQNVDSPGNRQMEVESDSDDSSSDNDSEDEDNKQQNKLKTNKDKMKTTKLTSVKNKVKSSKDSAISNLAKKEKQNDKQLKSSKQVKSTDSSDDSTDDSDDDVSGSSDSDSESGDSGSDSGSSEGKLNTMKAATDGVLRFDVDDKDDDLFTVKKNVNIDKILGLKGDEEPEMIVSNRSRKKEKQQQDKHYQAKKLMRKKIMVNEKTTFDDEGQPLIDPHKVPQVEVDTDRPDELGGINLDLARQRMLAEDKVDKEIYREKIKRKHREERLKRREENRKQRPEQTNQDEDEVEARLPSDDDERADPLSFIPDPDEVYGPGASSEDSSSEEEDQGPPSKKKRKVERPVKGKRAAADDSESSQDSSDDVTSGDSDSNDVMDTELSLRDDEELALRLLQGK